ncbi:MAG: hypothetical protein HWE23_17045 [Rhodobacteraceae bacterium]|nr:hypothetical protein [Paracoccaceae bacterium]
MDSVGIANTFVAQTQAQTSMALQSEMMKMSLASDANLVAMLQEGAQNLESVSPQAPTAPGVGGRVDVSA